jgi:hypothetical protein
VLLHGVVKIEKTQKNVYIDLQCRIALLSIVYHISDIMLPETNPFQQIKTWQ